MSLSNTDAVDHYCNVSDVVGWLGLMRLAQSGGFVDEDYLDIINSLIRDFDFCHQFVLF